MKKALCLAVLVSLSLSTTALAQHKAEDYLKKSQALLMKRDLEGAIAAVDKAIELKADYADAYAHRSNLRMMKGDISAALADLDKALLINTDLTAAYVTRGRLRMITGDVKGALNDFDNAIARGRRSDEVFSSRGAMKLMTDDPKGALADYNVAVSMAPDRVGHYIGRASARERLGDQAGALADYTYVIDSFELREKQGKIRKAGTPDMRSPIMSGTERPTSNPQVTTRIDTIVTMNPESESTMTAEEMEYLPNVAGAYMNRAQIYAKKGDPDAALADLNKSISVYPHFAAFETRAEEWKKRGDLGAALTDLNKSIELQPGRAFAYLERGATLVLMGKDAEAEKDFSQCLALDPGLQTTVELRRTEAKKQRQKESP